MKAGSGAFASFALGWLMSGTVCAQTVHGSAARAAAEVRPAASRLVHRPAADPAAAYRPAAGALAAPWPSAPSSWLTAARAAPGVMPNRGHTPSAPLAGKGRTPGFAALGGERMQPAVTALAVRARAPFNAALGGPATYDARKLVRR